MKIGIDVRLWNQTGVGRYIRNLVFNLEKIDKETEYILFARSEDKVKIKSSNFKVVEANVRWHSIAEQIKLTKSINKENLDLVHFPYYSVPVFYNKPFIVTIHDLIPLHLQTGKASTLPFPFYKFKFFAYRFVVAQASKKAKKIITPSNATKEDIMKYLKVPSSKIEVIYEGVDENLRRKLNVKKENGFLYVGNAYPHKNLEFIVDVFKKLPEDFKLIMIGKEDYFYKRLRNKVKKLGLLGKIQFFGKATDAQLSELYSKSKALIIPSFIEGFGLPVLEAMANECLVLSSDIPSLREVGGNAAVYFDPKNIDGLVEKIKNVSFKNLYQDKIQLGLKRSKEFNWEKTARKTLDIYKQSLKIDFA